jgi:hypothetical protein
MTTHLCISLQNNNVMISLFPLPKLIGTKLVDLSLVREFLYCK